MADGIGSRTLIRSEHWNGMRDAGRTRRHRLCRSAIRACCACTGRRIDLRNHRKILVIDNRITYCGSQNCADPEFRIKAKYAPWVDAMMRFDGPSPGRTSTCFPSDWMAQVNEDVSRPPATTVAARRTRLDGAGDRHGADRRDSAMPEVFETLMYAARRELVITTPYYVPNEAMQSALCASCARGVAVTIIFPARNDSWIVAAASRSYYGDLLAAGVRIFEYQGGLLHTKSLTLDGEVTLIGSANMDRRSFDLNYENNILLYDPALTAEMRPRQDATWPTPTGDRRRGGRWC